MSNVRLFVIAVALTALAAAGMAATGTETCYSKGEKTDGLNKICYYDCPSGEAAITIGSTRLCPLTIKR